MYLIEGVIIVKKYKALMCSDWNTTMCNDDDPEFIFFPQENMEKIESMFDVDWNRTGGQLSKEELIKRIADCDVVFTCWNSNRFDEEILEHAPKLKVLAHLAGSVAKHVTPELYDRGVKVIGGNDNYFAESVAEAALVYTIMGLRRLRETVLLMKNQKEDGWYQLNHKKGLFDRTVGLIGYGAVTKHFVRLLQPFHCKLKVYNYQPIPQEELDKYGMEQVSMEEAFATSDVVSVHLAWNAQTEGMVSKELMQSMKDGALLVNTARGPVIDEEAMTEELKTGRISAVLDVFVHEPLSSDSILYDLDNVTVIPHQGGPTRDRVKFIASDLVEEVYNYLEYGTPMQDEIPKERGLSMTVGGSK